jgi:hypothetical protein
MSPLLTGGLPTSINVHCDIAPQGDTTVVASLADGKPLVLRGRRNGKNRVDLNLYAPDELTKPEVVDLLVNALKYPRD